MTTVNKQFPKAPGVRQANNNSAPGKSSPVGGEVSRGLYTDKTPGRHPAPKVGTERNS
jgi:hypothetical protein